MEIQFLGHSAFRIKGKMATVVTDPFDPVSVGLPFPKVSADIVTVSHDHADHNKVDLITGLKRVVNTPGEYEISGVSILGFGTFHDEKKGSLRGGNTIFVFEMDDLRLLHLGDLGHQLDDKLIEEIGEIDCLFIPVGGFYTVGPKEASSIAQSLEPTIIIPMHYQMEGLKKEAFSKLSPVDEFVKEASLPKEEVDKLVVKAGDLGDEQKIVILKK